MTLQVFGFLVARTSALSDSVKVASLKEEVVRRLKNTSHRLEHSKRLETLEDLSQKMRNSGHKPVFIKNILIRGILRYESKLRNSRLEKRDPKYKPLHQPSGRFAHRMKKKAMAKSQWYKDQPSGSESDEPRKEMAGGKHGTVRKEMKVKAVDYMRDVKPEAEASTVMFVPNTKGGVLLRKFKGGEKTQSRMSGFMVKYAEAGGTQLSRMFNQDLGKGLHCGREVCPPCDSSDEKKRQNCRTRNILYETYCSECNPECRIKNQKFGHCENQPEERPVAKVGCYIGETSRSFHERMSEHSEDARKFSSSSHIIKHWMDHHPASRKMPNFKFRIRGTFKDCLTRQTTEAVAIMLHEGPLLNGKNDYLTNCITRVKVEEDTYQRKKREQQEEEQEKAWLIKLEKFKLDKSTTGTKRCRTASIHHAVHHNYMRLDNQGTTSLEEEYLFPPQASKLAVEYFPKTLLRIEYTPL